MKQSIVNSERNWKFCLSQPEDYNPGNSLSDSSKDYSKKVKREITEHSSPGSSYPVSCVFSKDAPGCM